MKVNKTTLFGVTAALASLLVVSGVSHTSNASPQLNRLDPQIVLDSSILLNLNR